LTNEKFKDYTNGMLIIRHKRDKELLHKFQGIYRLCKKEFKESEEEMKNRGIL